MAIKFYLVREEQLPRINLFERSALTVRDQEESIISILEMLTGSDRLFVNSGLIVPFMKEYLKYSFKVVPKT